MNKQNLLYRGSILQDNHLLQDYHILSDSTIILNLRLKGGATTPNKPKNGSGGGGTY